MYSFFKQCHIILITTDSHFNYGVILLQDYVEYAILPFHINWRISFSLFTKEIVGLYIKQSWTKHLMPNKKDRNSNLQNPQKAGCRNKCLLSQSTYDEMGGDKRSLRGLQATWPGLYIYTQDILSQKMYKLRTKIEVIHLPSWTCCE